MSAWFYADAQAWFYADAQAWFYAGMSALFYAGMSAWFYADAQAWFYAGMSVWFYAGMERHKKSRGFTLCYSSQTSIRIDNSAHVQKRFVRIKCYWPLQPRVIIHFKTPVKQVNEQTI